MQNPGGGRGEHGARALCGGGVEVGIARLVCEAWPCGAKGLQL